MSLRYSMNNLMGLISGMPFEEFMCLSRSDRRVVLLNAKMYTMLRVKPSSAGYKLYPHDDDEFVVDAIKMLKVNEDMIVQEWGTMANYEEQDGPGGKLVARNMARFVESWDRERISGEFWIVKITSKGTLVVKKEDYGSSINQLGKVYLVKGLNSIVGEQLPARSFPVLVQTTFLPMYNCLVYDGIMIAGNGGFIMSPSRKMEIQAHVDKALREQTVVYCGESASKGLWDLEPPSLTDILQNHESKGRSAHLESESKESDERYELDDDEHYDPTSVELEMLQNFVEYVKETGYKTLTKRQMMSSNAPIMVVRRLGYTKLDNPNQIVGVSLTDNPHNITLSTFKKWPTYNLEEILPQILMKAKNERKVPAMLWLDEKSLVVPMKVLLKIAFEKIGYNESILVQWYPPPSQEEQNYHQMFDKETIHQMF